VGSTTNQKLQFGQRLLGHVFTALLTFGRIQSPEIVAEQGTFFSQFHTMNTSNQWPDLGSQTPSCPSPPASFDREKTHLITFTGRLPVRTTRTVSSFLVDGGFRALPVLSITSEPRLCRTVLLRPSQLFALLFAWSMIRGPSASSESRPKVSLLLSLSRSLFSLQLARIQTHASFSCLSLSPLSLSLPLAISSFPFNRRHSFF
jgi:hypothetical protein